MKEGTGLNSIAKAVLWGLIDVVGGLFFISIFREFFNGLPEPEGGIIATGVYLGFTLVVCTGVIVSHLSNKE